MMNLFGTRVLTKGSDLSQNHKQLSTSDFHSLSIRDLLDARDQFHVHLAHKPNVFSTAIGR